MNLENEPHKCKRTNIDEKKTNRRIEMILKYVRLK